MTKYFIPEQSELGQWLLDLSACPGSIYDCEITKTELLEELDYAIQQAKWIKKNIKETPGFLDQYKAEKEAN